MKIVRTKSDLHNWIIEEKSGNRTVSIGLVPTMGYLHAGHLGLINSARKRCDRVVVSLFVNPTQFSPSEDFSRYPRNEAGDSDLCRKAGVDLLFAPSRDEMYSISHETFIDLENTSGPLCGEFRPGHFRGVATIVGKLFNLIQPDFAFFGQKDGQQCLVIQRMIRDLDFPVHIVILPTVREPDGLAMSSRNVYLDPVSRKSAARIYASLMIAARMVEAGEKESCIILSKARGYLEEDPLFHVQYFECRDLESLQNLKRIDQPCIIAVAAFLAGVRLIDNIMIGGESFFDIIREDRDD